MLTVNVPADSCYDNQISFHIVRSEWWDYLHHKPGRCPIWQAVSLQLVLVVKAGIYVIEYVEIFLPSEGKTSRSSMNYSNPTAGRKKARAAAYGACLMTLDFSSRYSDILAPITAPVGVNFISRYLPKRLELSLIAVQAFPKASTRGLTCKIFSRSVRLFAWEQQNNYFMTSGRFLR